MWPFTESEGQILRKDFNKFRMDIDRQNQEYLSRMESIVASQNSLIQDSQAIRGEMEQKRAQDRSEMLALMQQQQVSFQTVAEQQRRQQLQDRELILQLVSSRNQDHDLLLEMKAEQQRQNDRFYALLDKIVPTDNNDVARTPAYTGNRNWVQTAYTR